MKVILITVDDAKKTELKGAEKLAKSDIIILFSTKNKSDMPAIVKEKLDEIKAETEYVKLDSSSDVTAAYAYYAGYHEGKNHQTFIVAPDKTKLPNVIAKEIKIYTSFSSIVKSDSSSEKGSSSKKTSTTKKTSSSKKTSTAKKAASSSAETLITDTISNLTGMKKSDAKKLIKGIKDARKDQD